MKTARKTLDTPPAEHAFSPRLAYALVLLVVVFFGLIRFRLRDMPLERDEGEYAYAGQLMLQGAPPYQLAYNMKLPGTYAAYAAMLAIFGQTAGGVHMGLMLVNAATTVLIFLLAARLFGNFAGVAACASYGALSTSESVLGFAGHATHFVALAAVAGILVLLKAIESRRAWLFFWSGVLLGLAFVMKQPGLFFPLLGGIYLLQCEARRNWIDPANHARVARKISSGAETQSAMRVTIIRAGAYAAGVMTPFGLTCIGLAAAGVFHKFWFWTFSYAREYGSIVSLSDGWHLFLDSATTVIGPFTFLGIWLFAAIGLSAVWWNAEVRGHARFVIEFLVFSFMAVVPGLYFRTHYFIVLLPATALLAGAGVSAAARKLKDIGGSNALAAVVVLVFIAGVIYAIADQSEFLFDLDPVAASRSVYGGNPFPEAPHIADYLRSHSAENSRIAVLGSEPEIFFYAHRRSATPYIYTYELMEAQKFASTMQREMVSDIESARPEYVVYVDVGTSWLVHPQSDTFILNWAKQYLQKNYELVGVADILLPETQYRWGEEAKSYQRRSVSAVEVFRRKAVGS